MQLPRRQLGRNFKQRPALLLTMPILSDKARSSQPRAIFTLPEHFQEPLSVFEICTKTLEAATSAAIRVATPQLARCATPLFAHVHTIPSINFSINFNTLPIKMFCKCLTYVSYPFLRATWLPHPKLQLPRAVFPRAPTP